MEAHIAARHAQFVAAAEAAAGQPLTPDAFHGAVESAALLLGLSQEARVVFV